MKPTEFINLLKEHDLDVSLEQANQFKIYFEKLVETNEHVNLTAITEEGDVYLKHFYDSVSPLLSLPEVFIKNSSLIDIGAGAGFPSLPMKILRPDLEVTIVDSLNKRIKFLEQLVEDLGLAGVHLVHARAEDAGQNPELREQFDLVTARAVASLNVLGEYCLPFAKVGGMFVALKGPKGKEELKKAKPAIKKLGGKLISNQEIILPETDEVRMLTLIEKVEKTQKKYPRKAGVPSRKPL